MPASACACRTHARTAVSVTLSAAGEDGWLFGLDGEGAGRGYDVTVDSAGVITASGLIYSDQDLGGGIAGRGWFVARYDSAGGHLWSRVFDPYLGVVGLSPQAGERLVVVGSFHQPVELERTTYVPRTERASDLLLIEMSM